MDAPKRWSIRHEGGLPGFRSVAVEFAKDGDLTDEDVAMLREWFALVGQAVCRLARPAEVPADAPLKAP